MEVPSNNIRITRGLIKAVSTQAKAGDGRAWSG